MLVKLITAVAELDMGLWNAALRYAETPKDRTAGVAKTFCGCTWAAFKTVGRQLFLLSDFFDTNSRQAPGESFVYSCNASFHVLFILHEKLSGPKTSKVSGLQKPGSLGCLSVSVSPFATHWAGRWRQRCVRLHVEGPPGYGATDQHRVIPSVLKSLEMKGHTWLVAVFRFSITCECGPVLWLTSFLAEKAMEYVKQSKGAKWVRECRSKGQSCQGANQCLELKDVESA